MKQAFVGQVYLNMAYEPNIPLDNIDKNNPAQHRW